MSNHECCKTQTADLQEAVKARYGEAARKVQAGCASTTCCDPITSDLYSAEEGAQLPQTALAASLGCGNPTALADLKPGQVVLDLGSGGGIDVLLSARRVGPQGKAYGLDMTDDMLALARQNQEKSGLTNVEFLKGQIEEIPLPANTVDVIISNCVINLSGDKDKVLREAHRVLKPGGQLAISDIVVRGEVPPEICRRVELWIGCVAGALEENEYRQKLAAAGFNDIEIVPTRVYRFEEVRSFLTDLGIDPEPLAPYADRFMSAFVRARK